MMRRSILVLAMILCVAVAGSAIGDLPGTPGSIVDWGYDAYGQVSNVPEGDDFVSVAAGAYHGYALRSDGSLISWGQNNHHQVSSTPWGNDFVAIASGGGLTTVLPLDQTVLLRLGATTDLVSAMCLRVTILLRLSAWAIIVWLSNPMVRSLVGEETDTVSAMSLWDMTSSISPETHTMRWPLGLTVLS